MTVVHDTVHGFIVRRKKDSEYQYLKGSQQYAALFAVNEPSDGYMIIKRRLDSKEDFCDST